MRRSTGWKFAIGLAALLAVTAAARRPATHSVEPELRPIPAAPFASFDAASRAELVAYGRSLTFDTSYHASDSRRLHYRSDGKLVEGPMAHVASEIGSMSLGASELRSGRMMWRLTVDGPYPPLGLAKGVNYIWVDSTATGWRSVIVPEHETAPTTTNGFLRRHVGMIPPGTRPRAQFRWNESLGYDTVWEFCAALGCCEVERDIVGRPPRPRP